MTRTLTGAAIVQRVADLHYATERVFVHDTVTPWGHNRLLLRTAQSAAETFRLSYELDAEQMRTRQPNAYIPPNPFVSRDLIPVNETYRLLETAIDLVSDRERFDR